jgi:hypothetical protein
MELPVRCKAWNKAFHAFAPLLETVDENGGSRDDHCKAGARFRYARKPEALPFTCDQAGDQHEGTRIWHWNVTVRHEYPRQINQYFATKQEATQPQLRKSAFRKEKEQHKNGRLLTGNLARCKEQRNSSLTMSISKEQSERRKRCSART